MNVKFGVLLLLLNLIVGRMLVAAPLLSYLSNKEMTIGDTFSFTVKYKGSYNRLNFQPEKYGITVLNRDISKDGEGGYDFKYVMAIYSTGRFILPAFILDTPRGTEQIDSVYIYVIPLTTDADTDILDIKPIWRLRSRSIFIYAGVLGALLVLGGLIFVLLKKRHKTRVKSAYELATENLNRLLKDFDVLFTSGKLKKMALTATYELKRYFSFVFSEFLFDHTSQELLEYLKGRISEDNYEKLRKILRDFDLVKFAKYSLDYDTMKKDLMGITAFINSDYRARFLDNAK